MEIFAFTAIAAYKHAERELRNTFWRDIFLGRPMKNSFGAKAAQEMLDIVTDLKLKALPKVSYFFQNSFDHYSCYLLQTITKLMEIMARDQTR